jgi:putative PIN family toxin of toxin-antitoxin system
VTGPATPVVFDTVTLLQGGGKPRGPAGACLRLALEGRLTLWMSVDGMQELHDVLSREKTRSRFPLLTGEHVEAFLDGLRGVARVVPDVPAAFRYARDPDDEHVVNLAIACKARFLVTHDKDLLELMKNDNPDGQALRAQAPGLVVLTPPDFLRAVCATNVEAPPARGEAGENAPE